VRGVAGPSEVYQELTDRLGVPDDVRNEETEFAGKIHTLWGVVCGMPSRRVGLDRSLEYLEGAKLRFKNAPGYHAFL